MGIKKNCENLLEISVMNSYQVNDMGCSCTRKNIKILKVWVNY